MTTAIKLRYCTKCLYPSTKPRLDFDENGVCSACTAHGARPTIDWGARETEFKRLAGWAKSQRAPYDCIVPVSGGKDSTCQVLMALEYGLHPLAVTAMTDHLTRVGAENLANISKLGVDHVMVRYNQELRRKLCRHGLETVGDISWPEHVTIFTVPIAEAVLRGIPLVLYGENPENEYGGPRDAQGAHLMTRAWLEEFGGLNGMRVSDIIEGGLATREQMLQYTYPTSMFGCLQADVKAAFLGYYFPWDGAMNVLVAEENGFNSWGTPSGALLRGENLDNAHTGIHDRFKYLKFGFGRATDHACNDIRRGRITRAEGLRMVLMADGEFPWSYVGVTIQKVLAGIGMSLDEYLVIERQFMNPALFEWADGHPKAKFTPE